ncbi:MAG: hypothetical protein GDA44_04535 [Prochloron sp. SP5CPC1]|nr:hypothetical protein [Candidatus Paraprochloron terpiosi SP5CPC1]
MGKIDEQELLAMVAEEIKDPEIIEMIENWKGINVKGNDNIISGNTLTIS